MTLFNTDDFLNLVNREATLCVSVYSPTSRLSTDGYHTDKLHFRNLLTEARNRLMNEHGRSAEQADALLADAYRRLDDQEFWKHSSDLLAYFSFDGEGQVVKLPLPVETPGCWIGRRPYLMPLIPELNDDGHFYLLVLNLHQVSLFEVTRSTIEQITLPDDVPTSYTDETEGADNQKHLQHQSGVGQAGAIFHGQGSGSDEVRKEDLLQYFHRLSNELDPLLHRNPLPLVLVGAEYLLPIYRQATKYPHAVEATLTGSYHAGDMLALSAEAWQVMEPHFRQARLARKEEYGLFASQAQGSADAKTVVLTALSGGVDTLFVRKGAELWGTYHPDSFTLSVVDEAGPESSELLNEAASKTIEYGGRVYLVDDENNPAPGSDVAGIFRYPLAEREVDEETESAA